MNLETIVAQYGYPALIIGLFLEGETMLVLGAFMAHRGYLDLRLVILIGCLVSFASDQFFFWLGRIQGSQFLESRPAWKQHAEKAKSLLGWNTTILFVGIRFMYGLRTVLSFMLGMSKADFKKFAALNLIGALLWALTFGLAGQLLGRFMGMIFEDVQEHELTIALGIILVGAGVWLYQRRMNKVQPKQL